MLITTREGHGSSQLTNIIFTHDLVLDESRVASDDLALAHGIKHGQAAAALIGGDVLDGAQTLTKQLCHFAVDAVDLLAGGNEGLVGDGG